MNFLILLRSKGNIFFNLVPGGEEGRTSGWSGADPSRRRVSAPAVNAGSLSKQKNPVGNDSPGTTKEAMVRRFLLCLLSLTDAVSI